MINQRNAGIVIYTVKKNTVFYLLLRKGKKYWNFPKGRMEKGETKIKTALRETEEETGIRSKQILLDENFHSAYNYSFQVERGMVHTHIVFYLGFVRPQERVTISTEHNAFTWADYTDAKKLLRFKNSQNVLFKVHGYLLQTMHQKNKKPPRKFPYKAIRENR